MKTIQFDPEIYKLVPIEKTHEMHVAAFVAERTLAHVYDALLAAVPDDLPGVTVYSEDGYCHPECSPTYWAMQLKEKDNRIAELESSVPSKYPLDYTDDQLKLMMQSKTDPLSIIKATIEACANIADDWTMDYVIQDSAPIQCGKTVRALSPEKILAGMEGK